jgi:hypothetical protein
MEAATEAHRLTAQNLHRDQDYLVITTPAGELEIELGELAAWMAAHTDEGLAAHIERDADTVATAAYEAGGRVAID